MTTAPSAPTILDEFDPAVVARWVKRLSGNTSPRRNHWRTKELYFRAATRVLDAASPEALSWRNVVTAAGPRGRRSTFYEVAGSHARHRMVDDLISHGGSNSIQIALRYLRTDPVEQLIDETKVWSFWACRERFLRAFTRGMTPDAMEKELTAAVVAWTIRYPALAGAVDHAPPACAVEDLTVIHRERLSGTQAANRLTAVVRQHMARP
jgi:hypothetical protein